MGKFSFTIKKVDLNAGGSPQNSRAALLKALKDWRAREDSPFQADAVSSVNHAYDRWARKRRKYSLRPPDN